MTSQVLTPDGWLPANASQTITPAQATSATLRGWYDASQETDTDGTAKATITDRSTFGKNLAQATSGSRPTVQTAGDGKRYYAFDGVDDSAVAATASDWAFLNSGQHTVFAVVTINANSVDGRSTILDTGGLSSADTGFWLAADNRSSTTGPNSVLARSTRSAGGSTDNYLLTSPREGVKTGHRMVIAVRGQASAAQLKVNGDIEQVTDTSVSYGGTTPAGPLRIGARNNATLLPGNLRVHEVACYTGAMSDTELSQMCYSLGKKWGVVTWAVQKAATLVQDTATYDAFPALVRATNGDLIAVARRASTHLSNDGDVVMWRSTNLGATWSAPKLLYRHAVTGDLRDVGLAKMANGTLLLTMAVRPGGQSIPDGCRWATSSDNGNTWSAIHALNDGFTGFSRTSCRPCVMSNGTVLWALYGNNNVAQGDDDEVRWVKVYKSTDNAKTWTYLADIGSVSDATGWGEPTIVQTGGGSLVALIRNHTTQDLFRSVSANSGVTWSAPVKVLDFADSGPKAAYTPRGLLVCAQRDPDTIVGYLVVSDDDGVTWTRGSALTTHPFMYGDFVMVDSQIIFVWAREVSTTDADVLMNTYVERMA